MRPDVWFLSTSETDQSHSRGVYGNDAVFLFVGRFAFGLMYIFPRCVPIIFVSGCVQKL